MRVATFVNNLAFGGDENRVLSFARTVDRSRVEHHVVVALRPTFDSAVSGGIIRDFDAAGARMHYLNVTPLWMTRRLPGALKHAQDALHLARVVARLARLLRRLRIQVLDARLQSGMLYGVPAGCAARVPVILGTSYQADEWAAGAARLIRPGLQSGLDVFVSDSEWAVAAHRRLFGGRVRCAVIPNGIPDPRPDAPRSEVRRRLGIPVEAPLVGQVSNFHPYKGHHVLIDAIPAILARHPRAWFLLCGFARENGAHVAALRDRARRLEVDHRLVITSYPGHIGDVWDAIDVHAHASLRDSSPIAIHESMARGRPAVVTSVGGIPELVSDGVSGLLVPPDDAAALARGLIALLDDPDRARRLGSAARARYEASHRPEIMARAIEGLMERELARSRRRGNRHAAL
ncbi:MAG TPA: glycosyltransferase family 4 protein [Candidatus Polarisedimenticolia bacterium]|nr:glycosyltransferase family 4 protein [Candidatus Polarisedimenticolia bacterium]